MYFGFSVLLRPGFILQLGSREPYGLKDQKKQKSFFFAVKLLAVKILFVV